MTDGMKKCVHERISKPDHYQADADAHTDADADDSTSFSARGNLKCWRQYLPPGDKKELNAIGKKETVLIEREGAERI